MQESPKEPGGGEKCAIGILNDIRPLNKDAFPLMVQRYVALAYDKQTIQSASDIPTPILPPKLVTVPQEVTETLQTFGVDGSRPIIGFCPGAEFEYSQTLVLHYHYASLAQTLISEKGYQVLLFGSQKDHEAGEAIRLELTDDAKLHCHNFSGKTSLEQAVNLIDACTAVVSNDSGLMHVAAALGKPLVALYTSSSPDFTPPLSDKAEVIRLITGYHKVRKGDGESGYHQSLIDIQPQLVIDALARLNIGIE